MLVAFDNCRSSCKRRACSESPQTPSSSSNLGSLPQLERYPDIRTPPPSANPPLKKKKEKKGEGERILVDPAPATESVAGRGAGAFSPYILGGPGRDRHSTDTEERKLFRALIFHRNLEA